MKWFRPSVSVLLVALFAGRTVDEKRGGQTPPATLRPAGRVAVRFAEVSLPPAAGRGAGLERDPARRVGVAGRRSAGTGRADACVGPGGLTAMLGVSFGSEDLLAVEPVDMRKQFNGLWTLAAEHLWIDPFDGALFVFANKDRDIKLLCWDGTGAWVLAKRLEKGRFTWPKPASGDPRKLTLEPSALTLLLDGIDLKAGAGKGWYER